MVEQSLYLHNWILSHRSELLSQRLLRALHVEEANKIIFYKISVWKAEPKPQGWGRLEKEKSRRAEIQRLKDLNYISQEATGWAYNTQHARVPALETRSSIHFSKERSESCGVSVGAAATALTFQIILSRSNCHLFVEEKRH